MSVNESELPGIGRRYEILASEGNSVVVVVHHSGRRDLYILQRHEDEPAISVTLSDDQARRIGAILGGSYFKPKVVEEIEDIIGDFVVDWAIVRPESSLVGRTIGDLQIRQRTGMTVIAIVRGKSSINAPPPTEGLEADDRLVVVGPRAKFGGFVDFMLDH